MEETKKNIKISVEKEISDIRKKLELNKIAIANLKTEREKLKFSEMGLKRDLMTFCDHKYNIVYHQQITPTKREEVKVCELCSFAFCTGKITPINNTI